jgi:hypothetical protein
LDITSFSFTEQPVYHRIPSIYEDLGLPDLSSFIEQSFEFVYILGKNENTGYGSIRYYEKQQQFKIIIHGKLPMFGPNRLENVKRLLLNKIKGLFLNNLESMPPKQKVYYANFRRSSNDS